jgi:hypothetical protein
MFYGWKSDVTSFMKRLSQIATGSGGLYLFAASSRLALGLPRDRKAAFVVANLYQPHRWRGRIFLRFAKLLISLGIPKFRSTHLGPKRIVPEVDWLRAAAEVGSVGFLGCNPNHGPRCVLAGIDPSSGEKFIAKLGMDKSAPAIRREAEVLASLAGRYSGVIGSAELQGSDMIHEKSSSDQAMDWALLRLPHLGNDSPQTMSDGKVCELLCKWLGKAVNPLGEYPWVENLLQAVTPCQAPPDWHARMRSRHICDALLHGDFAVWNLRHTQEGLVALDWEWGREDGIGGVDLAHGLRQECYMVRGMNAVSAVAWMLEQAMSPVWSTYLKRCGWEGDYSDWLRLGLLHSHFNALNPSKELLAVLGIELT